MAARKVRQRSPEELLSPAALEHAALRYMGKFDSSAENLRRVLFRHVRRHGGQADAELVSRAETHILALVERYQGSGVLDDARYAEVIASSLRARGASQRGILFKLGTRGVDSRVSEVALAEADRDSGDAELQAARRLVKRRRLGPHRQPEQREALRDRDLGALARAGFSLDVARRALEDDG